MSDEAEPTPAYVTLARPVEAEIEVKRSRFLARLERVDDEAAARQAIEAVRRAHRDAGHHCSAFVLVGEPSGGGLAPGVRRSNDDGEPSGTPRARPCSTPSTRRG